MNSNAPNPAPITALKTILIIDDDVHLAATLACGLEAHGYRTLHAADAAAGWRLAHAHLPDLILSDIDMPGTDGRQLLKDMRADPALANRQFILMTGKTIFGGQRAAMDLGADDFLAKPFPLEDMLRCVSARLKRAELSRRLDDPTVERLGATLRAVLPKQFFNPLACILGLTELLQGDLEKLRPDEVRQDLRSIHEAGQQLLRTLRNYLLLLELDAPRKARAESELAAETVVDALQAGARTAGDRHRRAADVTLEVEGARVRAQPGDLTTVVEELVDNALRFSRPATPVQVRAWRDGGVLALVVTDAGRGLAPRQLEALNAAAQGPSQPALGHGLGLVLVGRLVRVLQGTFRLESREGEGTTAYVTIPVLPE